MENNKENTITMPSIKETSSLRWNENLGVRLATAVAVGSLSITGCTASAGQPPKGLETAQSEKINIGNGRVFENLGDIYKMNENELASYLNFYDTSDGYTNQGLVEQASKYLNAKAIQPNRPVDYSSFALDGASVLPVLDTIAKNAAVEGKSPASFSFALCPVRGGVDNSNPQCKYVGFSTLYPTAEQNYSDGELVVVFNDNNSSSTEPYVSRIKIGGDKKDGSWDYYADNVSLIDDSGAIKFK